MTMSFLQNLTLDHIYIGCATLGGALFVVRLILMFLGGDHGDGGGDGDVGDLHHDGLADSDVSFKILSLQGITAFTMMFGLVGLAITRTLPMGSVGKLISLAGGAVAGFVSVWVVAWIFDLMKNLQSTGELNIEEAIGQEGKVYLTIPANDTGKVQVTVRGSLKIYDAVTDGEHEIPTGERVVVERVIGGAQLVVTKLLG